MQIREDGDLIQITGEAEKTRYSSRTFMIANGGAMIVIQDPPENKGPKYYNTAEGHDGVTQQELSKVLGEKNANGQPLKATDIVMHRENKDGTYSVSTFKAQGWDQERQRVRVLEISHPSKNITREELDNRIKKTFELDQKIEARLSNNKQEVS